MRAGADPGGSFLCNFGSFISITNRSHENKLHLLLFNRKFYFEHGPLQKTPGLMVQYLKFPDEFHETVLFILDEDETVAAADTDFNLWHFSPPPALRILSIGPRDSGDPCLAGDKRRCRTLRFFFDFYIVLCFWIVGSFQPSPLFSHRVCDALECFTSDLHALLFRKFKSV